MNRFNRTVEQLRDIRDIIMSPRRWAACALVGSLAVSSAGATPQRQSGDRNYPPGFYDIYKAMPNFDEVDQGYYLDGVNPFSPQHMADPTSPDRTSLWFKNEGNDTFKMYATDPADPNGQCHWDQYHWTAGDKGVLIYSRTHSECGSDNFDVVYNTGARFAPKTWKVGEKWAQSGRTKALYLQAGEAVCQGMFIFSSRAVGEEKLSYALGGKVAHFLTKETQTWNAIPGAPESPHCPPGQEIKEQYRENFYFGQLPKRDAAGNIVGFDWAVPRSVGGNVRFRKTQGHPEWDSQFMRGWNPMPQQQEAPASPGDSL